ncbi:MAG: acyl-CoA thioesterase [Sphingobium sp.]
MTEKPITPEALVAGLVHLLDVSPLTDHMFRGAQRPGGVGRVFGGQVIGQALAAAIKTIDSDKLVHSLHAYFMRPGDEDHPIDYRVEADFDGGSFSNRRVVAMQKERPILNMVTSFQRQESGLEHQAPMPDVPSPEQLEDQADYARRHRDEVSPGHFHILTRPSPFEIRAVGKPTFFLTGKHEPTYHMWFRTRAPVAGGQHVHRAILAMATDLALLATSLLPHNRSLVSKNLQGASLDHALWFHNDVQVDDWLLYSMDSPWTGHARGFNRGMIFDRQGKLIASCAQEGLIRIKG